MDDLRQAFRTFRKQPGFAAVAVLTLAFGIGVNVTIFSIISVFFLQPLPIHEGHRLAVVVQRGEALNVPYGLSYPDYLDYRSEVRSFSDLAAFMPTPAHISAPGEAAERTWVEIVSPNYFALARVSPAHGFFPTPPDRGGKGAPPTVVLSYRYWQRRFGGDVSMVGGPITINGHGFTVAGIAPESFTGLSWAMAVSAFVPAPAMGSLMEQGDAFRDNRGAPAFRLMGRLAPSATIDSARAEMEVVAKRLASEYPAEHKNSRLMVIPENRARPDPSISDFLPVFAVVFAAMVALILLIACANVANLMLSRAVLRQRDLVVRAALGASRARLIRQQLVESLLLAAIAGAVGTLLSFWFGQLLSTFAPSGDIPVNTDRQGDWRIVAFTAAISFAAGIGTGLWPARVATRRNLVDILKDGGSVAGPARHRLRNLLVVGQVTMSLMVLASGALFLNGLRQLQHLAIGFRPEGLLMMSVDLGMQQYDDARGRRFLEQLADRAQQLPGVVSATVAVHVPFDYGMQIANVGIDGDIVNSQDGFVSTAFNVVAPRFFETTGVTLMKGRALDATDTERSRRVAVINNAMARRLWPSGDPVGRRFRLGRNGEWIEVVGVAADGKYLMLAEEPRPYFFVPLSQHYRSPATLIVRASADPNGLAEPLRRLLAQMDPDLPVFNVKAMDAHIRDSAFGLMPMRMGATMAGVQGLMALVLAVMGLYAVVSYGVTRRVREIGVRMALGAERRDVLRLVVREGMRLAIVGTAIGLLLALGVGMVMSGVLYGVTPMEARVFAGVTALVLIVSALACYIPARRAMRVDPLVALRYE
jgi:predicted permease